MGTGSGPPASGSEIGRWSSLKILKVDLDLVQCCCSIVIVELGVEGAAGLKKRCMISDKIDLLTGSSTFLKRLHINLHLMHQFMNKVSYLLFVDVPVEDRRRMAFARGAVQVDLVADLVLHLHPSDHRVLLGEICNKKEHVVQSL